MATQGVVTRASLRVPKLAGLVEGASDDLVTKRVVECDGIHHVLVTLERMKLLAGVGRPYLTRPVVTPSYETVPGLVKRAIR